MDYIIELLTNPFLLTGLSAWAVAQVMKVIINAVINKKLDLERLIGDGGMPSGHSATVTSLAVFALLTFGPSSFEFAISGILAIIVCHDAMGVRHETGKQAVILNKLMESFEILTKQELPDVILKELVGHTPFQVAAGILIGILDAVVMYYIVL